MMLNVIRSYVSLIVTRWASTAIFLRRIRISRASERIKLDVTNVQARRVSLVFVIKMHFPRAKLTTLILKIERHARFVNVSVYLPWFTYGRARN